MFCLLGMAWLDFEFLNCFLPLGDCVASSDTMKAPPQGGGSQLGSSSAASGHCLTCSVFSNRNLPSISGVGVRATESSRNSL